MVYHGIPWYTMVYHGTMVPWYPGAHPLLATDYLACTRLPCMDPITLHGPDYLAWTRLPCMDPKLKNGHKSGALVPRGPKGPIPSIWAWVPRGPKGPKTSKIKKKSKIPKSKSHFLGPRPHGAQGAHIFHIILSIFNGLGFRV